MTREFKVGDKVKVVAKHWLRGNHCGVVAELNQDPLAAHPYLVKFEKAFEGGGINGDSLYLDETQLIPLE